MKVLPKKVGCSGIVLDDGNRFRVDKVEMLMNTKGIAEIDPGEIFRQASLETT